MDWDSPKGDIERLVKVSQSHTNYHCSMASKELIGIVDLEGEARVRNWQRKVICSMSLREVLF